MKIKLFLDVCVKARITKLDQTNQCLSMKAYVTVLIFKTLFRHHFYTIRNGGTENRIKSY